MADFEAPEILRLPLEEICLRIKICGLGSIREVLDAALDRPSEKMIDNAIQTLQEVLFAIYGIFQVHFSYLRKQTLGSSIVVR